MMTTLTLYTPALAVSGIAFIAALVLVQVEAMRVDRRRDAVLRPVRARRTA